MYREYSKYYNQSLLKLGKRSLSLFVFLRKSMMSVSCPYLLKNNSLLAAGFNAYKLYADHHEHMQHHPREWVKYPYINYRCKVCYIFTRNILLLTYNNRITFGERILSSLTLILTLTPHKKINSFYI